MRLVPARRVLLAGLIACVLVPASTLPAASAVPAPLAGTSAAVPVPPARPAAPTKQKKNEANVAHASGTVTIRRTYDEVAPAEKWEEYRISFKNVNAKQEGTSVRKDWYSDRSVKMSISYTARYYTDDRSWHAGCDIETYDTTGTWSGTVSAFLSPGRSITASGKKVKLVRGWTLALSTPDIITTTTSGYYEDWESILMENCITTPITEPGGVWFGPTVLTTMAGSLQVAGNLTSNGKQILLTQVLTDTDETFTVDGRIEFDRSAD